MNVPRKIGQPRFLTLDEVLTLHRLAVDSYGGAEGVADFGRLDAALAMPRQSVGGEYAHDFPFGMASAYAFHLAMDHPFVDGNKRVAFAAMAAFLRLNGWNLDMADGDGASLIVEMIEQRWEKARLAERLMRQTRPRPSMELRDFFGAVDYAALAEKFTAFQAGPVPERVASILDAGRLIPAINQANRAAARAGEAGDVTSQAVLHQHALLLTVLFRMAEDQGYEW